MILFERYTKGAKYILKYNKVLYGYWILRPYSFMHMVHAQALHGLELGVGTPVSDEDHDMHDGSDATESFDSCAATEDAGEQVSNYQQRHK